MLEMNEELQYDMDQVEKRAEKETLKDSNRGMEVDPNREALLI